MARATNGDVELEWDERGPADGDPILLVMGIGAQMIAWRDGFCDHLVAHGHRVIRFDNRDAGLSSATEGEPPGLGHLATVVLGRGHRRARRWEPPYTFSDMAADGVAVLDAAGVERAHVVGASLGGMIAQTMAIEHPDRLRSLTSIMSSTGSLPLAIPARKVWRNIVRRSPESLEEAIEYELARSELIAGPLFDRDAMRDHIALGFERAVHPHGLMFQAAAMLASGDRTRSLRRLEVPTLVIHGRRDPLIRLSAGEATAKAIPAAKLVVYNEMAHDLPRPLWPSITDAIAAHARSVRTPVHP